MLELNVAGDGGPLLGSVITIRAGERLLSGVNPIVILEVRGKPFDDFVADWAAELTRSDHELLEINERVLSRCYERLGSIRGFNRVCSARASTSGAPASGGHGSS